MGELVNKLDYARMRGISRQAVYKAINTGKIVAAVDDNGMIDVEVADRLWAENTHPFAGARSHQKKRGHKKPEEVIKAAMEIGIDPASVPTLMESKTVEAAYKAKLAQIEYEEKTARLVDAEKIKKEAFRLARVLRDSMMAIPDRLAAELAGVTDPFVVHQKLTDEIRSAISEVAKVADE